MVFTLGNKILVILGPTATGKTDLALNLAKKFSGELVSCDSRQVYRGLDIGTGKLPSQKSKVKRQKYCWEIDGINIWMYDVVDASKQYSVVDYVKDAERAIKEIRGRGKLPIIVGGTGLYLKALLYGLPNLAIPIDKKLRKKLEKLSLNKLQEKLQELSQDRWQSLNESDKQNPRRLIRQIEISFTSEESLPFDFVQGERVTIRDGLSFKYDVLKIGLTASRNILYKRSDERVIARIKQGMINEAEGMQKRGLSLKRMKSLGLEYGVLADYLDGKIKNTNELIKIMQGKIHGFIRRQLTWFKKEKNVYWFDITEKNFPLDVEKTVTKWYYLDYDT